jgi:hypothetical protein
MAGAAEIQQWIANNQDKAGTPDFVTMTDELNKLTGPASDPDQAYTDVGIPIGSSPNATPTDPYSAGNTTRRVVAGAATGLPDVAIAVGNAGVRASKSMPFNLGMAGVRPEDNQEAPYLGPKLNAVMGGQELPADASTKRRLLEGGGSALLGGGLSAVRAAIQNAPTLMRSIIPALTATNRAVVAPTVTSHYGGEYGGKFADSMGFDKETGALIGSLLGGSATAVPGVIQNARHASYAGQGKPDAAAIAEASRRQGIDPTAGMLGNVDIQGRERALSGQIGAMDYINNRRQGAIDQMNTALDRITTERGAVTHEPTEASVGQAVTEASRNAADDLRLRSEADQQRLADMVGRDTPVPVQGVYEAGWDAMPSQSVPGRQALDFRLNDQLTPLLNRDVADGPPNMPLAAPYEPFRNYRTDLGKSIDTAQGGRMPPTSQLYAPATEAMRGVAEQQGVPRQDFDNIQGRTRQVEQTGGDFEWLDKLANREPGSAFNYLEAGARNPDRLGMLEATQRPEVPGIMGDYLRMIQQSTLGRNGARGPINFAESVSAPRMDPAALDVIAGPQVGDVRDVATAARAINYPTSQTGLTRSTGPTANRAAGVITGSEVGSGIGSAIGNLLGIEGNGAATAGRIAGALGNIPIAAIRARLLEGPTAINALGGGAAPPVMSMGDLVAALNAANAGRQQGGPRRGLSR